ncbi:plexin-C1 isoform X5 [Astyanax mexicanus]|uniref:plexin-C1 isoform X3 n=1 Tax=Astyanax mexicanus TaxID=7994 RepID=UPI0020CB6305|nr:plexin-C1 isoform X3 [Astyanax mexicanus]XP_049330241.1 plexin-C1 isoform X5 [Astyanax mexicanus]
MKTVLALILLFFKVGVYSLTENNFNGDIRNFVVGNGKVFVVTDSQIIQMKHDLIVEERREISNLTHPNTVTILLPFQTNKTLITCGTFECGYCEVLDLNNISTSIYWEDMSAGPFEDESSVAFLVDFNQGEPETGTYMLVARKKEDTVIQNPQHKCLHNGVFTLWNTLHSQHGGIFSKIHSESTDHSISPEGDVEWVDGFQTSSPSHSYLLVNVQSLTAPAVIVLKMENSNSKSDMIKSLQGSELQCCDDKPRRRLLSSSGVNSSGSPFYWVGVFTAHEDPENTVLAIYNFSQIPNQVPSQFSCSPACRAMKGDAVLTPRAVVLNLTSMTSVAAEKKESWIVIYIGTRNGQLMKMVLDKELRSSCVTVLYRSDDDRMVFPRMHFDQVDHKHIYIALRNQIRRVAVTQCDVYRTLRDCRASQDPLCGWCVTTSMCSTNDECSDSSWISIPEASFEKNLITFHTRERSTTVTLELHLNVKGTHNPTLTCTFKVGDRNLCHSTAVFPSCSCSFSSERLPANVTATVTVGNQILTESLKLRSCPDITENSPFAQCVACVSAGCDWSNSNKKCNWISGSVSNPTFNDACQGLSSGENAPKITSLEPSLVSFHGRNNAVIKGENLRMVEKIRFQGFMECTVTETKVLDGSSDTLLKFNIPKGNKGNAKVCVVTADGLCHSSATITYGSTISCTRLQPTVSWASGRRKIQVIGENLAYVETVHVASDAITLISNKTFWFHTYSLSKYKENVPFSVSLRVGNLNVSCTDKLIYHPDPEFTTFSYSNVEKDLLVTIQKTEDKLNISTEDINVQGWFKGNPHVCHIQEIKSTAVICKIFGGNKDVTSVDLLKVEVGDFKADLVKNTPVYIYILVALIILILIGSLVGVLIHRKSQRKMSERMNERLEELECEIRSEIRQGFVDLQTEHSDLIQNVGAIPFLDYKHFALKIFFPEGGPLANMMIKDISQVAVKIEVDEKCQVFSALIRDQTFLTCFVHALEEQKNFSIKDKCVVASLLTVALHGDLPYLTQLMEDLLQSLMDQPSNAQPKLLLRRTESIVEKVLTNWMSICLYGFLRESVGQPLFLLVSALTQQISKGPVDAVTEKALYTLNEDWLLWQAQDFNFSPLKLNVLFAVGTEGEVSESLEVNALTCDTIEQVKEKILQTFQRKFGFPYTQQQREIDIEYEKGGRYTPLEEVDGSSEVQGEVTMLNTLKHYQVPDGASIKVMTKKLHAPLSPQTSVKDDQNFSTKYFHLIDPDIDKDESNHPERKKLKLKEIYLTKLLSTKVAVHSFVENLFRSIWGMPNNKAPSAVKYFFDFLDAQAEKKKVTDPDVVHIWKTNSLPLRFWINILKNPNFVFSDLEKTPHLDACLSVIAQAFMDSFSLTDQQLGKHAPTNKLLYAKDIPQYKQEVKMYYKLVKDQPSVSSQEFKTFLQDESKKHESEFNESAALRELYKYMDRYFSEITEKLNQRDASSKLKEEMNRVKELFDDMKKSSWT